MADTTIWMGNGQGQFILVKMHDNGDGTYSMVGYDAAGAALNTLVGAVTEAAPASDTASSGLNGRLQRIAQRITSLIALLPAALGANGGMKVEGIAGGVAQPVSGAVTAAQGAAGAAAWPTSDAGPAWTSTWGISNAPVTSADMSGAAAAVIDAPAAGLKFVITDITVTNLAAVPILFTFTEETSGLVLGYASAGPNGGMGQITWRGKRKTVTAIHRVMCQTNVAGNVSVLVGGYVEA